jgi:hypothetical protein
VSLRPGNLILHEKIGVLGGCMRIFEEKHAFRAKKPQFSVIFACSHFSLALPIDATYG